MPACSRIGARPSFCAGFFWDMGRFASKPARQAGTCPDSRADRPSRPGRDPILERRADVLLAEPPNARQVAVVSNMFDATDKRCCTQPRRAVPRRTKPRRGGAPGGPLHKRCCSQPPGGSRKRRLPERATRPGAKPRQHATAARPAPEQSTTARREERAVAPRATAQVVPSGSRRDARCRAVCPTSRPREAAAPS